MKALRLEWYREKRTGLLWLFIGGGILSALYAITLFAVRREMYLSMKADRMVILLTQMYGVIMMITMIALIVGAFMLYNIEFQGSAIKKLYMLPIQPVSVFGAKFLMIIFFLMLCTVISFLGLLIDGILFLPEGDFVLGEWIRFGVYSFVTALPVAGFMILIASQFENPWIPLGVGVGGLLSGMALGTMTNPLIIIDPFVIMMKPAMTMTTTMEISVVACALLETVIFFTLGLFLAKKRHYE